MLDYRAACAVWDFDGTLIDSFKIYEEVLPTVLQKWGFLIPHRDILLNNYHGRLKDAIQAVCGVEGEELDRFCVEFIEAEEYRYQEPSSLYFSDAVDLLRRNHAAGVRQIIVSNRSHHNDLRLGSPRNLARQKPLKGLIDAVVCGDDNEFYKPDARMLDAVECELGVKSSQIVVIGDQFVDAELAHNLGARAVLVTRNGDSVPHLNKLRDGWEGRVELVKDLHQVSIESL